MWKKGRKVRVRDRFKDATLLDLKVGEGARSQRIQAAFKKLKWQEADLPLELPEGTQP